MKGYELNCRRLVRRPNSRLPLKAHDILVLPPLLLFTRHKLCPSLIGKMQFQVSKETSHNFPNKRRIYMKIFLFSSFNYDFNEFWHLKATFNHLFWVKPKLCCFFENFADNQFKFTALHSADKFLKEQQIFGLIWSIFGSLLPHITLTHVL